MMLTTIPAFRQEEQYYPTNPFIVLHHRRAKRKSKKEENYDTRLRTKTDEKLMMKVTTLRTVLAQRRKMVSNHRRYRHPYSIRLLRHLPNRHRRRLMLLP